MLENIKSLYFIKNVFSKVNEGRKLKLSKYNKKLQNYIDINLINYMSFTNKYIIYEENGKGKEYDVFDKKLIFDGEYKNGERNGKGKEYDENGKLKYEGEYLNGKRHGKGKEYNFFGHLIFEGEYLNDKKWNGKTYEINALVSELKNGNGYINDKYFKGEIKNGERNGKGKEYDMFGKLVFDGEYLNGKKWNGKGYYNDQIVYVLRDGKGYIKEYIVHNPTYVITLSGGCVLSQVRSKG